jgi:hypothetical protein
VTYQAFSAAISTQNHVDLVLQYICQKEKISQSKCKVLAYRVSQARDEGVQQSQRTFSSGGSPERQQLSDNGEEGGLVEGFDDGGEEGSG